jgi:hypothetical protein
VREASGGLGRSSRRSVWLAAVLAAVAGVAGCATYTDKLASASLAASGGNFEGAITATNGLLGVASSDQLPARLAGDKPLLLLDRGTLQQATGRFEASQRDLSAAEQKLELLDLSTNAVAALGSYLYSDSAKTYKTPPAERLSLNAVNLLNYLTRGDLSGAAIEARRFQVMREFLASTGASAPGPDRRGAYRSGCGCDPRGDGDRALRYYDEVLAQGGSPTLAAPVRRLALSWPYRGKHLSQVIGAGPATRAVATTKNAAGAGGRAKTAAGANAATRVGAAAAAVPGRPSELLVVLALGRVPTKVPRRLPVGAAVGIAGAFLGDRDLDVLRYSASKVIVYPELAAVPSLLGRASVEVDGREAEVELVADIGSTIIAEYQAAKPKILAAALTRVAARAALAEGTRAAGRQESQALGDVLAILVEASMVALDKPDTRSWTMLPDKVLVARMAMAPGRHEVVVRYSGGGGRRVAVTVPVAGSATVVVTEPR